MSKNLSTSSWIRSSPLWRRAIVSKSADSVLSTLSTAQLATAEIPERVLTCRLTKKEFHTLDRQGNARAFETNAPTMIHYYSCVISDASVVRRPADIGGNESA